VKWVHRNGGATLADEVRRLGLPKGEGYVWIAAETEAAKALRLVYVDELHHPRSLIRAAAYWRKGATAVHEVLGKEDAPGA
jgi:NADPH-dependent ferric siderophore reductase